jgi:nitrite reductase/ring-hydroxylating ferredoxin subunit
MSPSATRKPAGYAAVEAVAGVEALDKPADVISKNVRDLIPKGEVKDALSGTWLGHAFHPLMTDVVIGTWLSAVLLDWLGGRDSEAAAQRLIGLGLASAPPTFASGWNDWADTAPGNPPVKRVGLVHALSNGSAAVAFSASWLARRRGDHARGRLLALAGGAALGVGGMLGGHLSFAEGVGVDQTTFDAGPEDWTAVLAEGELRENVPQVGSADGVDVLLVRSGGTLRALADRCCHRGGALHEGELRDGCVICPLHGSTFRLDDGSVERGPAAYPQPVYDARIANGMVEIRRR